MDYIVFGTGYGATLMLLGWILRTFGPDWRYRIDENADPPGGDFILARMSWRRFAAGLGAMVATAGMLFVIITFILIFFSPSNSTGTLVVLSCFAVVLIAVAVWTWLYVGRYGTFGIVPERKSGDEMFRTEDVSTPEPAVSSVPVAADPGYSASSNVESEDDALFVAPEEADDEGSAERTIRMSRYQGHGPGPAAPGEHAAPTVEVPGSHDPDDVPDDEVANEVDDSQGYESSLADDVDDVQPAEDAPTEDVASESADEASAHEISADVVASDVADEELDEDHPSTDDGAPDDHHSGDAEDASPKHAGDRETEAAGSLEDTPEARAEALRRIQAWNPDDPDKA